MIITVSKKTKYLWQLRLGLVLFVLNALVGFFNVFTLWMLIPTLLMLSIELLFIFWYMPKYFTGYKITLKNGAIVVENGVVIKKCRIMPYARLIYVSAYASPLAKMLKLQGLIFRATRGAVFLPEIGQEQAKFILEAVREGEE